MIRSMFLYVTLQGPFCNIFCARCFRKVIYNLYNHTSPQLSCLKNIPDLTKHTYTVNVGYSASFILQYDVTGCVIFKSNKIEYLEK